MPLTLDRQKALKEFKRSLNERPDLELGTFYSESEERPLICCTLLKSIHSFVYDMLKTGHSLEEPYLLSMLHNRSILCLITVFHPSDS